MENVKLNEENNNFIEFIDKKSEQDILKYFEYVNLATQGIIKIRNYNIFLTGDMTDNIRNEIIHKINNFLKEKGIVKNDYVEIVTDKNLKQFKDRICVVNCDYWGKLTLETMLWKLKDNNNVYIILKKEDNIYAQLSEVYWRFKINIDKELYIRDIIEKNELKISKDSKFVKELVKFSLSDINKKLVNVIMQVLQENRKIVSDKYFEKILVKPTRRTSTNKDTCRNNSEDLDNIIGLGNVKEQIKDIINYASISKKRNKEMLTLHMCFMGNARYWKNDSC